MYIRFCENKGWKTAVLNENEGTMGGYKEVQLEVSGDDVYGTMKFESGVHRVQRVPDTEASGRVHTSAATVAVMPEAEEVDFELNMSDVRRDTFRASGAGGQHVNKTDSAVRITHLPSGLVVSCQNDRSQHSNRQQAMRVLQARLVELNRLEQVEEINAERGHQREIGFGSQIRTYTCHPFTLVKDHRTGVEIGQVEAVMNGMLDPFIEGYLRWKARGSIPLKK
jgi:peptide chain release factor 2